MPVHYPQCAGKPYRPSNGTEGDIFREEFCDRCVKEDYENDVHCPILTAALWHSIGEADYPVEWIYDHTGRPTCKAFDDGFGSGQEPKYYRCPDTLDMFETEGKCNTPATTATAKDGSRE